MTATMMSKTTGKTTPQLRGPMFLTVCLIEAAILITFLATEKVFPCFICFLFFLLALHHGWAGYRVDLYDLLVADVPRALGWFLGYLAVGGAYSLVRWYFRVRQVAKKMGKVKARIDASMFQRGTSLWWEMAHLRRGLIPSRNAALITGWIAFFPLDAVAFTIEEPVRRAFRLLSGTYARISKSALGSQGLTDDLENQENQENKENK